MGVLQNPIMTDMHISDTQFTFLSSSVFLITHVFMQIPAGIIASRYGLRTTILIATASSAIINLFVLFVHTYSVLLILRSLMALMSSFGFIFVLLAVFEYIPKNRQYLFTGLSELISGIGITVTPPPMQHVISKFHLSWNFPFLCFAIWNTVLFLCFLKTRSSQIHKQPGPTTRTPIKNRFNLPMIFFITILSSFIYFPMDFFSENCMHIFLQMQNLSATKATSALSMVFSGYAIGGVIIGHIIDKTKQFNRIFIVSCSLMILSLISIFSGYFNFSQLSILFFILGVGCSSQQITYPWITQFCSTSRRAISVGYLNACVSLVTAVFAPIFSSFIEHNFDPSNAFASYQNSFLPILIFPAIPIALIICQYSFFSAVKAHFFEFIIPTKKAIQK